MTSANAIDPAGNGFVDELQPGTLLMHGQYKIRDYLNSGGFGITYLATDSNGRVVVIKECFPSSFCRRSQLLVQARSHSYQEELQAIVRLFTREAEALERLSHPNIVGVHQVFQDNNTAYMALDFVEGRDLLSVIKTKEIVFDADTVKVLLTKLLDAIGYVHDAGLLHRDISPDNVIVTNAMEPVLIDFGAAREQATKATRALSALRVVKDGYSPQEFYIAGSEQSPSSDLYSLAATFYHLITGEIPPDSQVRLSAHVDGQPDPYVGLAQKTDAFDPVFCAALDKAMSILPRDRVQSAREWLDLMAGKARIRRSTPQPKSRLRKADGERPGSAGRSKAPVLVAMTALVAAVGGGAYYYLDQQGPGAPAFVGAFEKGDVQGHDASREAVVESASAADEQKPEPPQARALDEATVYEGVASVSLDTSTIDAPAVATTEMDVAAGPSLDVRQGVTAPSGLSSGWFVELPFEARRRDDLTIASVTPDAPDAIEPGLKLLRVQGVPVSTWDEVINASRLGAPSPDGRWASVSIVMQALDGGELVETNVPMAMIFESTLPSGLTLHTRWSGDAWKTVVADTSDAASSTVREGDVIVAILPENAPLANSDDLRELLTHSLEAGEASLRVAVRRNGSMWVETMAVGGSAG